MSEKSFEQALSELEQLVKDLEQGDIDLNSAVEKYKEGMKLSKYCHSLLTTAEDVIVKLMNDEGLSDFNK
jgi:exodeoxyribonuclease VII small subunit